MKTHGPSCTTGNTDGVRYEGRRPSVASKEDLGHEAMAKGTEEKERWANSGAGSCA